MEREERPGRGQTLRHKLYEITFTSTAIRLHSVCPQQMLLKLFHRHWSSKAEVPKSFSSGANWRSNCRQRTMCKKKKSVEKHQIWTDSSVTLPLRKTWCLCVLDNTSHTLSSILFTNSGTISIERLNLAPGQHFRQLCSKGNNSSFTFLCGPSTWLLWTLPKVLEYYWKWSWMHPSWTLLL